MMPWRVSIAAVVAATAVASAAPAPEGRFAPKGRPGQRGDVSELLGTHFLYVAAIQEPGRNSGGLGATIVQADPALGAGDYHSLAEIAVESADAKQIVEIGWTVDAGVNGDLQPHVFSYHWVDGQTTCYNGCGWVQVSTTKQPGMRVAPGEPHVYEIKLMNGDWWLFYDGEGLGYYPQSLWGGRFTAAGIVQWFGEVAAAAESPCTQMGNGKLGADLASASYDGLHLFDPGGASVPAAAQIGTISSPALYDIGRTTGTSFGFGGPGVTTGCCMPSACAAMHAECGTLADPTCAGNALSCGFCDGPDVCSPEHICIAPSDRGGCCGAGASGAGSLVLGALVALGVRRRRRR